MREIKLYTSDKRTSVSLNDIRFLASEITGLGNNFSITYHETSKNKTPINVKSDFENIEITIYFNADGNGYFNYKYFLDFLQLSCGKIFPLEYNNGFDNIKFCDVILKNAPKTQIGEDGLFCEKFIFERQTYWYLEQEENFSLQNTDTSNVTYPLPFPFGFIGKSFINNMQISNDFFESVPINLTIVGPIAANPIKIIITDNSNNIVSEIWINKSLSSNESLIIDSLNKKINLISNEISENAYYLTDKLKQSFLYLSNGTYNITSNLSVNDKGSIIISVKKYLLD